MQVRWNYKLQPNKGQRTLMGEWLVTLRKHRNYLLREREQGWETNNRDVDTPIHYVYGAHCDIETRLEVGSCCPLTCPVIKSGIIPHQLEDEQLLKTTKEKIDKKSGKYIPSKVLWDSPSGLQSKRTTQLRRESKWYKAIDSGVLQRNLAKLDAAYSGFWHHQRGFPAYRTRANFKSWENKPGRCTFEVNRKPGKKHRYSHVSLPGIGRMRYLDSRPIPENAKVGTVTVKQEADGWYISVLLDLPESLPDPKPLEECTGVNGLDRGINKLIASSDGSFVENPRVATDKKMRRRFRIRQRRVNRKVKGSHNRAKAGIQVATLHRKVKLKREAYQWHAALREVKKAEVIALENLNVKGMKSRCKPKQQQGRFMPNGQSAKRGLNRSISDASWASLGAKMKWLAAKEGKQYVEVPAAYSSQECRCCKHQSPNNRDGEKFICEVCGHIDHADTQAGRTIAGRVGLKFVSNRPKKPSHTPLVPTPGLGESYALCIDSASDGKRNQAENPISKRFSLLESLKPEYEAIC
jgi:putative transposase